MNTLQRDTTKPTSVTNGPRVYKEFKRSTVK